MSNDKKIIIVSLVLLALVGGAYYFFIIQKQPVQQMAQIKDKAEKFINEKLVSPGTQAKIKEIIEESGLYKILVSVGGQDITAYISKDGENFFPQVIDMSGVEISPSQAPAKEIAKKDIPEVELFVMSYCPYGLQIEKGILPVVQSLGSKINFSLKFLDYTMHGDKEIQENLRQYCVRQQGLEKLINYLTCFVKQGDAGACLNESKIDKAKLTSCVSATDAKFKITQNAKDKALWKSGQYPPFDVNKADVTKYGVSGSPSLVINGTEVSAPRDPAGLLKLICSGFSVEPAECGQQLSGDAPSSGFGEGTSSGASSSCGN